MRLAYVDVLAPQRLMILPRKPGESKEAYALRFADLTRGLGRVHIVTVRGARSKRRATRGW